MNQIVSQRPLYSPFCYFEHKSFSFKAKDLHLRRKMSGEEVVAAAAETPVPALGEPMDIMTALQLVLRKSLTHAGLARGLHEGAKIIEKNVAQLCVLAEDCDWTDYVKLVKGLCADHNISLISVPSAKSLGEWAGDYGEETEGLHIVQEYVKSH